MSESAHFETSFQGDLDEERGYDIAVIGLAGRFPGAENIEAFWHNLVQGTESIRFFTREEMEAAGVDPQLLDHPHYVNAGGHLDKADYFDSNFFGFYPREADILDPQHRIFLEVAWEAVERAGYNPDIYNEPIGLFAGMSMGSYIYFNLLRNRVIRETVQPYQLPLSSDKDFLTTRVSYKLNLKGPSVDVQTACSTSLVAVHLACQSLINYECDMALAGGVSVRIPQKSGYLYQEGGILSPDGHCRPFSADAKGTVSGEGAGVVVLKRLENALQDGDSIYAVIKGTSINNDGAGKVGYTAPSVDGQAKVIANAQVLAGVDPASISYIEAHGTGTMLGDPIEIEALTHIFREHTDEKQFCAIGSVKANIGHLDAAAGVAGLIKTVLALHHKQLPPSINFTAPNPQIDFQNSPFFVQQRLSDWHTDRLPRRAGVSSFGMGGTNAHAVLEEAPPRPPSGPSRAWQLIPLSTRTPAALEQATDHLAAHFRQHHDVNLADAAYTLKIGRKTFKHRRMLVAKDVDEAATILEHRDAGRLFDATEEFEGRPVAFMFSGQGAQYVNMARDLYHNEPLFAREVDHCAELLRSHLDVDIRRLIFPLAGMEDAAEEKLKQTRYTQPALFVVEYALAKLWMHWGVQPSAMIGHSIGEYVAATLAGVFDLESAVELVSARGRLMQSMPAGAMLSVQMSEADIAPYLAEDARLSLAGINAPGLVVASGPFEAVDALERRLDEAGFGVRRLHTSHAFHSSMMSPILTPFAELVERLNPQPPQSPFISDVTGDWITPEQATDPAYWAQHLRQAVRFADGIARLLGESYMALLEVGPGNTLSRLAQWNTGPGDRRVILHSLRHPRMQRHDQALLLETLGQLWMAGVEIDWEAFYEDEVRRRISLPTYPFQRQRHWIEPDMTQASLGDGVDLGESKRQDVSQWLYTPSWRRAPITGSLPRANGDNAPWLILRDKLGDPMSDILKEAGFPVMMASVGERYERIDDESFTLQPGRESHLRRLFDELDAEGRLPQSIIIAWNDNPGNFDDARQRSIATFIYLAKTLHALNVTRTIRVIFIGHHALDFSGLSDVQPAQAMALGPCKVIREEFSNIRCRFIDVEVPPEHALRLKLARKIARDITLADDVVVAYRGGRRWVQTFEPLQPPSNGDIRLRQNGVYLITGGLGNMGLLFARYLTEKVGARLALVGRTPLPPREAWAALLDGALHDDPLARKIRAVRELEDMGAEVLLFAADVADEEAMHQIVQTTITRFGALHGVFHAAGVVGLDALAPLAELESSICEMHYRSKLWGTLNLASALKGLSPDFVLLQSSLSAIIGGYGMAAYAAVNAFMDAFAVQQSQQSGVPWMSINWDGWAFDDGGMTSFTPGGSSNLAILPDEGLRVLEQVLAYEDLPQVLVSTTDINARMKKLYTVDESEPDEQGVEEVAQANLHPRPEMETPFVAPQSPLEAEIAALWEQTLGIGPVGVNDDFFELGGHSLLATQIVSRLRDRYAVSLPLRRLFESPTVAGLAQLILDEQEAPQAEAVATSAIQPIPRGEDLPLSPGQQRLWFLDQLDPGTPLYNNFAAIHMHGAISMPLLAQSLNAIIQRHEVLRTTFHENKGRPVQRIHDEMPVHLPVQDISDTPDHERDALIQKLAIDSARKPFHLGQGPLLRAEALRLGEDEHVIFFTMHHIVSDGWSVAVLIQELAAIYRALATGQEPALPPLSIQYADFAAWQLDHLQSEEMAEQVAWWRQQLADIQPLELPTDRPRPPVQTPNGANEWFELPPDMYHRLIELAQRQGVTPFMLLTAGLSALLHRYTMQDDIALGTPIANRTRVETEGLIGFLLNTLVLRTDLSGDPTFVELLARVKESTLGAYDHQDVPFEMLVDALQPERDMSRTPFFQVMIDLQQSQLSRLEIPDLTLSLLRIDDGTAKFDMAFSLEESTETISGYVNYNTDLFDRARIQRLISHLIRLLDDVTQQSEKRISQLSLLSPEELAQLDAWGGLMSNVAATAPDIMAQFEARVAATPDAVAVRHDARTITYGELNARANQLAHALLQRGVGPEQTVGVLLHRTPDLIVAVLGILKAGAAFVILAPDYPDERMQFILEDAGVTLVIGEPGLPLPGHHGGLIADIESLIFNQASTTPDARILAESAAYIIYTSGTTGQPKGVVVGRGPLSLHIDSIREVFGVTSEDRVLQFAALSFDQGLEQAFVTLTTGATLVMRGDDVWPPEDFTKVVQENQLSVINLPPAYLGQVMRVWAEHPAPMAETSLRLIISGGEALTSEIVTQWRTALPHVAMINAYGPTEAIITAATYHVPLAPVRDETWKTLPIGQPVAPRVAVVLDTYGNRTPIGVPGELCIGGDAIARGYLNRPGITADAFRPREFLGANANNAVGHRLYRTGDLVRFGDDGALEFLGRIDHQVKVRGFRIELGEIEAVLRRHPAIDLAVVHVHDNGSDKRLIAYIYSDDDEIVSVTELHDHLRTHLPHYMIPGIFIPLEDVPLTRSGKVNRRALPSPEGAEQRLSTGQDYAPPSSPVEEDLVRIWREVLDVERVGIHDNFFELGGHSLLATQIASRVRELYDVDVPLRTLFESPTIAQLAALITEAMLENIEDDELDDLLDQLEDMTEEELMRLLEEDE